MVGGDLEDLPHIDLGGCEELLSDALGESGDLVGPCDVVRLDDLPGEGESVGVDARGPEGDDEVALLAFVTGDDVVLLHVSEACTGKVHAVDDLGKDRDLAAHDLHVGEFGTLLESYSDLLGDLLVGLVDGDVVHEGCGLGVDADGVVHIHRDAVDTDGVPFVQGLGDHELGSDPVGGHGDVHVPEVDQAREKSGHTDGLSDPVPLVAEFVYQGLDSTGFLVDVDSRFRVGPSAHFDPHLPERVGGYYGSRQRRQSEVGIGIIGDTV